MSLVSSLKALKVISNQSLHYTKLSTCGGHSKQLQICPGLAVQASSHLKVQDTEDVSKNKWKWKERALCVAHGTVGCLLYIFTITRPGDRSYNIVHACNE
ncbi:hypothetical protein XENOCAPTIV_016497 [Xenoophorus captivus]|uniref:Uncharacterized protein n=1 Tax=Xenoophorus captivus TaxID=1517983 RepID=A0ABV0QIK2_9TELE